MNRDDIIHMAREAGLVSWFPNSTYTDGCWWIEAHEPDESLERFAALVAAAERKACLKLCDARHHYFGYQCAEAIRARGKS